MRLCVMHYIHRYRVIEKLVEDWKNLRVNGTSAMLLEALIPECIEVAGLYRQAWQYLRGLVIADPNGDEIETVGKILKPESPRILALFQWIQEMMAGASSSGSMIKDAGAFEAAAIQVREINAKIEMVFPELNKEMAEVSLAEIERGEYQTIEELIREIQGHSAAAH